jgi:hypothetical protein
MELQGGETLVIAFDGLTIDALTAFVAFELQASSGAQTVTQRFVRSLSVEGMPTDRMNQLLASLLKDKEQLVRLLWLLLESQGTATGGAGDGDAGSWMPWSSAATPGYPLFEKIMKALASDPARIREIGRLIDDLSRTSEAAQLLPEGLLTLWQAIKAADLVREP